MIVNLASERFVFTTILLEGRTERFTVILLPVPTAPGAETVMSPV